jgi:lysozyme
MRTSDNGVKLIEQFEGRYLNAYRCPAGVLTIGYGHTTAEGPPVVKEGMRITEEEADTILRSDVAKEEGHVSGLVKVPLSQNQFDALVSFCFNVGPTNLANSTLLRTLNAGNYDAVPAELLKWTRGGGRELPGLVRRRQAEAALWKAVDVNAPVDQEARLTPDAPQPSKSMLQSKEGNAAIAAGGAGSVAIVSQIMSEVQDNVGLLETLVRALGRPTVISMIVVVAACVAIWWWRKRRLDMEG